MTEHKAPFATVEEAVDGAVERGGVQKLERNALIELQVVGCDNDAHPAHAEDPLDTVFSGEQIALPDRGHASILNTSRPRSRITPKAITLPSHFVQSYAAPKTLVVFPFR